MTSMYKIYHDPMWSLDKLWPFYKYFKCGLFHLWSFSRQTLVMTQCGLFTNILNVAFLTCGLFLDRPYHDPMWSLDKLCPFYICFKCGFFFDCSLLQLRSFSRQTTQPLLYMKNCPCQVLKATATLI